MHMIDADLVFSEYAGWPYILAAHSPPTGAIQITAGALFDAVDEYTYFGDSDGHLYVVTEDDGPDAGSVADEFDPDGAGALPAYPIKPDGGNAITAAPLYEGGFIYVGNANGKIFKINRTTEATTTMYNVGTGITIYDMAYIDQTPVGPGIGFSASNGKTYYIVP